MKRVSHQATISSCYKPSRDLPASPWVMHAGHIVSSAGKLRWKRKRDARTQLTTTTVTTNAQEWES